MVYGTGDSYIGSANEVVILLATYNGARYISDQIKSIQSQTFVNWNLIIRDDGSTDDTVNIIKEFSSSDSRIKIVRDEYSGKKSAKLNFNSLMKFISHTSASYIFFSDQDDIWVCDKMEKLLTSMSQLERVNGKLPVCIYTDMKVVNDSGGELHESFMKYQGIKHLGKHQLRVLVTQNYVTGCTMLINRPLLDVSYPVPEYAVMHDWWIAQLSSALGVLSYIDEPLVKYRQHDANVIGAKKFYNSINPLKNKFGEQLARINKNIDSTTRQSAYLLKRIISYSDTYRVSETTRELCEAYSSMRNYTRCKRVYLLLRYRIRRISKIEWSFLLIGIFFHKFS